MAHKHGDETADPREDCWEITVDHIDDGRSNGTMGPSDGDTSIPRLEKFRMYDDDDELYYEGVATHISFGPMDDFGMPNAGCTRIDWFENGKWQML